MDIRAKEIDRKSAGFVAFVANAVTVEVVNATPVDTGKAQSNWRASVGSPLIGEIATQGTSKASTIAAAASVYRVFSSLGNRALFLTNNAGHIGELNAGKSPQAPAGFIGDAVRRGFAVGTRRKIRLSP
jgi:hypothetical protein